MIASCDIAVQEIGNGLAASLRGVDCMAGSMAEQAFSRLFGSNGALGPALTILLTMFIALFGYALLTGRSNVSVRSLTPRMVTLGLVLTFATSWIAFQSVFWNLAILAPDQIAGIMTGSDGSATQLFADKIDIVFAAFAEIAGDQSGEGSGGMFTPPGLLWLGAMLFLLGTVGVLVTTRIALAVLVALGPIFVVLALFNGTRGLFVGWLKGIVLLSIAPLLAVLAGSLMLEMTVPVLNALQPFPGEIDARAAFAFFLIGFVHVSLMLLAMKTATTMVGGWSVFSLVHNQSERSTSRIETRSVANAPTTALQQAGSAAQVATATRRTELTGITAMVAANDAGGASSGTSRETRIYAASDKDSGAKDSTQSRARGIGSRFRSAPQRTSESIK